jgi:hypothetical protein
MLSRTSGIRRKSSMKRAVAPGVRFRCKGLKIVVAQMSGKPTMEWTLSRTAPAKLPRSFGRTLAAFLRAGLFLCHGDPFCSMRIQLLSPSQWVCFPVGTLNNGRPATSLDVEEAAKIVCSGNAN